MATNKLIFNLNLQYLQNSFPRPTISSTPSCFEVRGSRIEFNCGCSSSKLEHLVPFEGLIENVSRIRMEKEKAEGECDKGLAINEAKHNLVKANCVPYVKKAMHGISTRRFSTAQKTFDTLAATNMDGQELTESMQKTTSTVSYANTSTMDDATPTPPSHYKWRLLISYDGTRYAGRFPSFNYQCIVEKALMKITKLERDDLHFVGASRTDTGVHAWGQVAHFITPFNYDSLETIHAALNGLLPSDIRIREMTAAVPEFHARFSAKSKIYHYKIYNDSVMDPFQRHYAYHSVYKLNTAAMREAAKLFIGKHNFSAFVNASRNDRVPDPVKTIFRFDVVEMGALLQLEVEGSGFLYRQVRNMVALLLQIGKEAIPPDIVPKILASQDRRELAKYALSAPPHGLCLVAVKYKEEHVRLPLGSPATSFGRYHTVSKCKLPFY